LKSDTSKPDPAEKAEAAVPKPDTPVSSKAPDTLKMAFTPPGDDDIPKNAFGDAVRLGEKIFRDTQGNAREFVGNSLRCANCHLDSGRQANAAPLWAAYVAYPAYRKKNEHVNTFEERLQDCFLFSVNGKAPAANDKVMVALQSYAYFLAKGAAIGAELPGRGYPKLANPAKLDDAHGQQVYAAKCALCHGPDGQGKGPPMAALCFRRCGGHGLSIGAPA
jgi:thiosulfate dehydrogenase